MKTKLKYSIFFAGILVGIFISCKKEQQPVLYFGYDYFPNKVGHYVIYQCDSIIFDPFKKSYPQFDTFQYQIKEVIDSIFPNNSGQATQRIVRYKRTNDSIPWTNVLTIEKVWTGNLLPTMAKRQEDNNVYIKLVFPMTLNETWNGNAYNTIGQWNYQYIALNMPATINGTRFDSTLTVLQQKDSNFLNYQYYFEQYATGIGLINKVIIDYSDTLFISIPPPSNIATGGTILYSETYLSSGNQ
jgi:hypothetical protein